MQCDYNFILYIMTFMIHFDCNDALECSDLFTVIMLIFCVQILVNFDMSEVQTRLQRSSGKADGRRELTVSGWKQH